MTGARIADHAVSMNRSNVVHAARAQRDGAGLRSGFVFGCAGRYVAANRVEMWHEREPDVARRAITCRSCIAALDAGRCRWLVVDALVSPGARALVEQHETSVLQTSNGYRPSCTLCGLFGPCCDTSDDARPIADRHAEIGGFER